MLEEPINVAVANNKNYMCALGVGEIKVVSLLEDREIECNIKNVLFIPNSRKKLLSVKKLDAANIEVIFDDSKFKLLHKNEIIGIGFIKNLYDISFEVQFNESGNVEVENKNAKLWHKRFGHICTRNLEKLVKNKLVIGIEDLKTNKVEFCDSCARNKLTRSKFGIRTKAKRLLEIIHTDVAGPINPISHDGCKYFVTFIDDYSNFVYVYGIKNKSEVFDRFKEYILMVQSKLSHKVSVLQCDNGREYISNDLQIFCKQNGTFIDYTKHLTPQSKTERPKDSIGH